MNQTKTYTQTHSKRSETGRKIDWLNGQQRAKIRLCAANKHKYQ